MPEPACDECGEALLATVDPDPWGNLQCEDCRQAAWERAQARAFADYWGGGGGGDNALDTWRRAQVAKGWQR